MTVTYINSVATSSFHASKGLLFRWRGSLWKGVYLGLSCWLVFYFALSILYRFILNEPQRMWV